MLTLHHARIIIAEALKKGANEGLKPLTVCVLDPGGALIALERSDGSSKMRPDMTLLTLLAKRQIGFHIHQYYMHQPLLSQSLLPS